MTEPIVWRDARCRAVTALPEQHALASINRLHVLRDTGPLYPFQPSLRMTVIAPEIEQAGGAGSALMELEQVAVMRKRWMSDSREVTGSTRDLATSPSARLTCLGPWMSD